MQPRQLLESVHHLAIMPKRLPLCGKSYYSIKTEDLYFLYGCKPVSLLEFCLYCCVSGSKSTPWSTPRFPSSTFPDLRTRYVYAVLFLQSGNLFCIINEKFFRRRRKILLSSSKNVESLLRISRSRCEYETILYVDRRFHLALPGNSFLSSFFLCGF